MGSFIPLDEDKQVMLYTRELKQGTTYYARFRVNKQELANNQKYLRESMKTANFEAAKNRANQRFAEISILQNNEMVIRGKTVEQGINLFVEQYEKRFKEGWDRYTKGMLRVYKKHVLNYWVPYAGDLKLSLLREQHFREYENWRRGNWRKSPPAERTIQLEISSMKSVMTWCRQQGLYSGEPISYVYRMRNNNRRSAFSIQQYRRIVTYLRTNDWLVVGKHNNDSRIIRHRMMLREYFLFACNIGMRIGEMREIRWRDVTFAQTDAGKKYVRVRASQKTKLKSKGATERIGRATAARALQRLRETRTDNLGANDFVFCNPDGKQIAEFREGFNTMLKGASSYVPKNGEAMDCEFDTDGVKYTPYCCRHTYITYQLRYRKHSDVYAIASNCATSISMIEQYYSDARGEDFVDKLI
ncbi:MAG: tyrosine-type recombinase/integrase [Alphaproteobacteria bacterium]